MNKSAVVHLKNKYPGCSVIGTDQAIDVFSPDGEHLVAVRKDGNGQWVDEGDTLGARDPFDLSPIPKHARYWKLHGDGRIAVCEEGQERLDNAEDYAKNYNGKVPSLQELAGGGTSGAQLCKQDDFLSKFKDGEDPVLPAKRQAASPARQTPPAGGTQTPPAGS